MSRAGRFREHQARHVIAEGVLLPVEEVVAWGDLHRIGKDRRAAVGRRAQADDVR